MFLSLALGALVLLAGHDSQAQSTLRLQCGKLGLVTLSNQFTLITYADGNSSKRVDSTPAMLAKGTVESASSVRFTDGTVMSLRAARGAEYLIQKEGGVPVACMRK